MTAPTWPSPVPPRRSNGGLWVALAVVVLVVAAAGVLLVAAVGFLVIAGGHRDEVGSPDITHVRGGAGVVVIPGEEGDRPEMIAQVDRFTDEGSESVIVRSDFDGDTSWEHELEEGVVRPGVAAVVDGVVLINVDDDRLLALDAEDGDELWVRPGLVDAACADCLHAIAGVLISTTLVGDVRGLDLATGEPIWSRTAGVDGHADIDPAVTVDTVVVGEERADGDGLDLVTIDPTTGEEIRRFAPACTRTTELGDEVVRSSTETIVEPVGDVNDIVVVFGLDTRCVQRWAAVGGEQGWATMVEQAYGGADTVVDDERVVIAGDGGVIAFDLADGTPTALAALSPEGARAAPLAVVGDVLVAAEVVDDRRSGRLLTWDLGDPDGASGTIGIDAAASLAVAGQIVPGGSGALDGGLQVLVPSAGGLRVVTFPPDDSEPAPTLTTNTVDLARGLPVDPIPVDLHHDPDQLDPGLTYVNGVDGDLLAVTAGDVPQLVDLETGAVVAAWPVPE